MLFGKIRKDEDYYLNKAIRGEREGFEYLVSTYQKLAFTLAMKICRNTEDAEEVVQDAFMKAFAGLANFRSASKFSTWLYKIVYHTALTKKDVKSLNTVEIDDNVHSSANLLDERTGFNMMEQADRKHYINLVLAEIEEDERAVITLHYLGEKSTGEIADILDIGKSAVKMRLLRGRKKLEVRLKDLLNDELKDLL